MSTMRPPESEEELARESIDFVKAICRSYQHRLPTHVDYSDVFGAGLEGLFDAIRKYRSEEGVKFRTYAEYRIRGTIQDYLRDQDFISRGARSRFNWAQEVTDILRRELGREPTSEEVRLEMWLAREEFDEIVLHAGSNPVSIDELNGPALPDTRVTIEGDGPQFDLIARQEASQALLGMIRALPPKQAKVLELYFFEGMLVKHIGALMGFTESRASQLLSAGVSALQLKLGVYDARRANYIEGDHHGR